MIKRRKQAKDRATLKFDMRITPAQDRLMKRETKKAGFSCIAKWVKTKLGIN